MKTLTLFCAKPDIGKNHQVRKKYTIQLGENELVLKVRHMPIILILIFLLFVEVLRLCIHV